MSARKKERRRDMNGELRLMGEAEGYVMVRRRGCFPFVIPLKEWNELPVCAKENP